MKETELTIRPDDKQLKRNLNSSDTSGILKRWLLRLSKLHFEIMHGDATKSQATRAPWKPETGGKV